MTAAERLVTDLPVTRRRLDLAGVSTRVLDGGSGRPVVLLHEQGQFAAQWRRVIPELTATNRVLAPDLPGHGASHVTADTLTAERLFAWLSELIDATCTSPPVLVGHMGAGALAARFAIESGERLAHLVLVDSFGLARFRPTPRFALSLLAYVARPSARTYAGLMRRCTADFDAVRDELGDAWAAYEEYTLERVKSKAGKEALHVLMRDVAVRPIPPSRLEAIDTPTTLIWGRHDPAIPLHVAQSASRRYGWPLRVIDGAGDDPPIEQPRAFLDTLRTAVAAELAGAAA